MAAGDVYQEYGVLVKNEDAKASTAVTKGQVIKDVGNGFEPVGDADEGKAAVALDTITAAAADRNMRGLVKGIAEVDVASGFPINFMDELICAANGKVKKVTVNSVALLNSVVGYAMNITALTGSGTVPILLK